MSDLKAIATEVAKEIADRRTKQLSVRLRAESHRLLAEAADRAGISINELVGEIVDRAIRGNT